MKALTVQQPWAWAIAHGGKNVENRTQQWTYRGPLAIHAGQRWSDRGLASPLIPYIEASDIVLGAIIAIAELVDVHPEAGCCKPWGESSYVEHGGRERRRITHLVLENRRALDVPIPCKGALGLWTPPADIVEQIQEGH